MAFTPKVDLKLTKKQRHALENAVGEFVDGQFAMLAQPIIVGRKRGQLQVSFMTEAQYTLIDKAIGKAKKLPGLK